MTKRGDKIHPELLDEVSFEVEIRAAYYEGETAMIPVHLLRRMHEALVWGADEIVQLREDFAGAVGAVDGLTEDNIRYASEVEQLCDLIADRPALDLMAQAVAA